MLTKVSNTKYIDPQATAGQVMEVTESGGTISVTRLAMTGTAATVSTTLAESEGKSLDDVATALIAGSIR